MHVITFNSLYLSGVACVVCSFVRFHLSVDVDSACFASSLSVLDLRLEIFRDFSNNVSDNVPSKEGGVEGEWGHVGE